MSSERARIYFLARQSRRREEKHNEDVKDAKIALGGIEIQLHPGLAFYTAVDGCEERQHSAFFRPTLALKSSKPFSGGLHEDKTKAYS